MSGQGAQLGEGGGAALSSSSHGALPRHRGGDGGRWRQQQLAHKALLSPAPTVTVVERPPPLGCVSLPQEREAAIEEILAKYTKKMQERTHHHMG